MIAKGTIGFTVESRPGSLPIVYRRKVSQIRDGGKRIAAGGVYSYAVAEFYLTEDDAASALADALSKCQADAEKLAKEAAQALDALDHLGRWRIVDLGGRDV